MIAARVASALILACLAGCGEASYLVLDVDAPLEIPGEADGLTVTVRDCPPDPGQATELASIDVALADGDEFPIGVLLQPEEDNPAQLTIKVTATLSGEPQAFSLAAVTWQAGASQVVSFPPLSPL